MKQLLKKISSKRKSLNKESNNIPRITNDTLAEHREAVIAKGKRYKYPMQQTKHRIVIISSIILVALLVGLSLFTWFQLYRAQATSDFFYRITQILPLPVAKVDNQTVLYKDYLTKLRSSLYYLQTVESVNLSSEDGKRQVEYQKRNAMNSVLEQAYVDKIAKERNITVSDEEVNSFIKTRVSGQESIASEADYKKIIQEFYGWTAEDTHLLVKDQLLRHKVVAAVDIAAKQKAEALLAQLRQGIDFGALAKQNAANDTINQAGGDVGFVSLSSEDPDGLINAANALQPNQLSEIITGANGLFIVKTLEKRADAIRFARLYIPFEAFKKDFEELQHSGKIQEYIEVPKSITITS
ncbi:MAG TPA: peptidylprolyl isomerase [Candidatus Saccharimonadales bacterium]